MAQNAGPYLSTDGLYNCIPLTCNITMKSNQSNNRRGSCHDLPAGANHTPEISRINRLIGQLEGVKRMISEQRYCPDILVQTKACSAALRQLEAKILERHLEHCVSEAFNGNKSKPHQAKKIEELIEIFRTRLK